MSSKPPCTATIHDLDAARRRRHYIELAKAWPDWNEVVSSFALHRCNR